MVRNDRETILFQIVTEAPYSLYYGEAFQLGHAVVLFGAV